MSPRSRALALRLSVGARAEALAARLPEGNQEAVLAELKQVATQERAGRELVELRGRQLGELEERTREKWGSAWKRLSPSLRSRAWRGMVDDDG